MKTPRNLIEGKVSTAYSLPGKSNVYIMSIFNKTTGSLNRLPAYGVSYEYGQYPPKLAATDICVSLNDT